MKLQLTALASALVLAGIPSLLYCQEAAQHIAQLEQKTKILRSSPNRDKRPHSHIRKFTFEPELKAGIYTYIVELSEKAIGQYDNAPKMLAHTKIRNKAASKVNSNYTQAMSKIKRQQTRFLNFAKTKAPKLALQTTYSHALNGMAIRLTQAQAMELAEHNEVVSVTREKIYHPDTDRGPSLIGAPMVWDGSALATVAPTQGEGVVVGIIDSGINSDHPSFAEVSGDAFVHTNPLGDGVYLGDCAVEFPQLCNNKLIGIYSYSTITNDYSDITVFPPSLPENGEDYGGHGSHVAATAAGNILYDVDEVLPENGEEESSGVPTGFTFSQLSGVAPRANIISYQICYGGSVDAGDTYGDCPGAAIIQGIESAILDGVDVINYSISGGGAPWDSNTERAFLRARNAGIFVATSAGNSGPNPSTTVKNAPWYTSVAASEHGRQNVYAKELTNFSGGTSSLGDISGQSNTGSISGAIVYAGDYTNPNDPGGDPAQCLEPFPSNTFSGEIVLCDRGEIARVEKAENVQAGGANGYILANVQGGDTFLANDQYVVPGIHINANDGDALRAWLQTGTSHSGTITAGVGSQFIDTSREDVLASFSSRGPNATNSTLAPSLSAPGVDIYAAYSDQQFGHDGDTGPAASDFNYLSGTSMASPHVAGAAALVKSAHPSWTPDQIRSALSLTTTSSVLKEDASTAADFFDMGAGRIQVDKAIASGLIMDETAANYANADPDLSGDPRSLNLPSITDSECKGTCTWSRTFTATTNATWDISTTPITDGLTVSASPASFTLVEGQSQTVQFEISSAQVSKSEYAFAEAVLTSPGLPDARVPISILATIGDLPLEVDINSSRNIDSLLISDINVIDIDSFYLSAYKPVKASVESGTIIEDSENDEITDDINDGTFIKQLSVSENAKRIVAEIVSSTAQDLDLYLALDANNDGAIASSEIVAESLSSDSFEEVALNYPVSGNYFIIVQSFTGTNTPSDDFTLQYAVVANELALNDELSVEAPSALQETAPIDMRFIHNLDGAQAGDTFYAAVDMGTSEGGDELGLIAVDIMRGDDDVSITGLPARVEAGDLAALSVEVAANTTNETRNYSVVLPLPVGTEFASFSTEYSGTLENNQITWQIDKDAGNNSVNTLGFTLRILEGVEPGPINVVAQSVLSNQDFSELESSSIFTDVQIEGAPEISFNGQTNAQLIVREGATLTIPITIYEPNSDAVNVVWTQTQGPSTSIDETAGVYSLQGPSIEEDTTLMFDVSVSDGNNNTAMASIEVDVRNNNAPVISSVNIPETANGGQNISISINASDADNDTLSYAINGSEISGNTSTQIAPSTGTSVSYTVSVSDGIDSTEQTVTVSLSQSTSTSNDSGGGGSMPLWILSLAAIAWYRRTKN